MATKKLDALEITRHYNL